MSTARAMEEKTNFPPSSLGHRDSIHFSMFIATETETMSEKINTGSCFRGCAGVRHRVHKQSFDRDRCCLLDVSTRSAGGVCELEEAGQRYSRLPPG